MKCAVHALMGALIGLSATGALAQAWPAKPVTWIVPFAPGGPADVIARVVALKLGGPLGQPVIILNRGGGTTNIGYDAAARAAPETFGEILREDFAKYARIVRDAGIKVE